MNWNEIDIMKRTPEDYLKMRARCKELERDNILKQDHIMELMTELEQLRAAAKDSAEKIEVLNDSIGQLRHAIDDKDDGIKYWADKAHKAQERIAEMIYKGDGDTEAVVKDADAKIQSANDRAANAKKEAKAAKERADNGWERVRYLERKLRDVESLNDSLMKELARREPNPTTGVIACEIKAFSDADAYQKDILKYAPDFDTVAESMAYAAIGLCGEAGEASEIVKKHVYHGHPLDDEHLMRELGDVLWYVTYMAHLLNCPLSTIMALNLDKLTKRYPDGKFDAERSRHREEGDI